MTNTTRPDWNEYFMGFARQAATRSTCDRKHVGAVAVVDRRVVATGYNGAPRGWPSCDEVGHDLVTVGGGEVVEAARRFLLGAADLVADRDPNYFKPGDLPMFEAHLHHLQDAFEKHSPRQSCLRTIHAEENVVISAARHGTPLLGATLYTTASPCGDCFRMLTNVGITRIVYGEAYASARSGAVDPLVLAAQVGIEMHHHHVENLR